MASNLPRTQLEIPDIPLGSRSTAFIESTISKLGFQNSLADPCLYSKRDSDGGVMLIGVYVDDIVLAHKGINLDKFIKGFSKQI